MLSQEEIDSLLSTMEAPDPSGGGTSSVGEDHLHEQKNYKLYNFRRPDKFSKDHLRALQSIHENFARQFGLVLTAYLRTSVEVDVVSVDQLTYDEFIRSMPSPITVSIMELAPMPGQALLGLGYDLTHSMINRMLGGTGQTQAKARELTDIEQSLIKRVIERASISLEEAWGSVVQMNASLVGIEDSYALIQVASATEIVALITFEVNIGNKDSGLMSFCLPYPMLEEVMSRLSAQRIFHNQLEISGKDKQEQILTKLRYAKVEAKVLLGGTEISIKDLVELVPGDVIQLDRGMHQNLLLCVNNRPKFYCRPGTLKNNLAVSITQAVDDEEAIEGFGLNERTRDLSTGF